MKMNYKGIVFSEGEVRQFIDNRKLEVRVPVIPRPVGVRDYQIPMTFDESINKNVDIKCPYRVGDNIYIRERYIVSPPNWSEAMDVDFNVVDLRGNKRIISYPATCSQVALDAAKSYKLKIRLAYTMPIWASRLNTEITAIRLQFALEMNYIDLMREGFDPGISSGNFGPGMKTIRAMDFHTVEYRHWMEAYFSHFSRKYPAIEVMKNEQYLNIAVWVLELGEVRHGNLVHTG